MSDLENPRMFPYELPIPFHPSHDIIDSSKLKTFVECPRKFFFEYLCGWRSEHPNNHLVFGTALHEALEHLMLHGYEGIEIAVAFDKFLASYRKEIPEELDELFFPKTPERVFECLFEYCQRYKHDLERYEVLHTEIAFRVMLTERYTMTGRMDTICNDLLRDNKKCSLDHKSASSFRGWEKQFPLSFQAGLYTHALYCLYGFEEVSGITFNGLAFLKVKGNKGGKKYDFHRVDCPRSKAQMQTWFVHTIGYLDDLDREFQNLSTASKNDQVLEAFPLRPTSCNNYGGCGYFDFCDSWPNPLRYAEKPPIGFKQEFWNPLEQEATVRMDLGKGEPIIEKT